jgi:uncharacterized membrane protein YphA (DoxX/SURF4 family)
MAQLSEPLMRRQGMLARQALPAHRGEREEPADRWETFESSSRLEKLTVRLGRAIFGGYFLYNGINHFVNRTAMTEYARAKRVPAAEVAVPASGALLMLGGLFVMTGLRPKLGSSLITTFLIGVTPVMHAYWRAEDESQRMQEFVNFTKNIALIGGAATAAYPDRLGIGD